MIPTLALRLKKKFVLIRKEDDDSHHGGGRLLGELGERWIFVDDFISTGKTRDRVVQKISEATTWATAPIREVPIETTFVGQYMYCSFGEAPKFEPVGTWSR